MDAYEWLRSVSLGQQFDEIALIFSQKSIDFDARISGVFAEQIARIPFYQFFLLAFGVAQFHAADNPIAQPQFHIGFNHIGIQRLQHHIGTHMRVNEGFINFCPPRKSRLIGNDRILGDLGAFSLGLVYKRIKH